MRPLGCSGGVHVTCTSVLVSKLLTSNCTAPGAVMCTQKGTTPYVYNVVTFNTLNQMRL